MRPNLFRVRGGNPWMELFKFGLYITIPIGVYYFFENPDNLARVMKGRSGATDAFKRDKLFIIQQAPLDKEDEKRVIAGIKRLADQEPIPPIYFSPNLFEAPVEVKDVDSVGDL